MHNPQQETRFLEIFKADFIYEIDQIISEAHKNERYENQNFPEAYFIAKARNKYQELLLSQATKQSEKMLKEFKTFLATS